MTPSPLHNATVRSSPHNRRTPLTRRQFLRTTSSTLALAALSPAAFSQNQPAKKRPLKKGFMMNAFPEGGKKLTLAERFKMLKEAGFDGAEPRSHLDQKEVLDARDASGLEIASVVSGSHTRSMS